MKELFIKKDDYIKRIELNEIICFTKTNNKVIAITMEGSIEINSSLYYLSEILGKTGNFIRCHKSFIVNVNKIDKIYKYNNKTYNICFKGTNYQAFITQRNLKMLSEKFSVI